ncbi:MAG TPA: hypothetical protein PK228_12305, partial [Saprospiraceae bacterium]|nr:hypothetical protein [Saprospiraceae bacterium]
MLGHQFGIRPHITIVVEPFAPEPVPAVEGRLQVVSGGILACRNNNPEILFLLFNKIPFYWNAVFCFLCFAGCFLWKSLKSFP